MKETTSRIDLKLWARLLPILKTLRKHVIIVAAFMLISALAEATFPLFTSYAVNHFVIPGTTVGVPVFTLVFVLVIVLSGVGVIFYSNHSMIVEMHTGQALKHASFMHLQTLPLSYYNQTPVGYILARVIADTDRISGMVAWGTIHLAWNICYILGVLIFMFILDVRLALILLLVIPIVGVITWLFQRRILSVNRHIRELNSVVTGTYNEGITGARTSKTLVIEEANCAQFERRTAAMYRASMRASMLTAILLPLVLFCGSMAIAAVLFKGGNMVMVGGIDFGILSAFISYAVGIIHPVQQIAGILVEIVSAQAALERVTDLLDEEQTIRDTPDVIEKYGTVFAPKRENWEPIHGDIEFKNVWFKYPDGGDYILTDFNLKIPAGSNVAIVGETGAGKSTIVNLICRFFEPTQGQILIDGRDYRERSQLWLHSNLGYVLQNPHLFSGTIAENIRYGRTGAADAELYRAAELVSVDSIVKKLPEGYDTQVGEGGDCLSTGEKQLISFARAILADPPIFILDEATSSIDTETEQLIQHAIRTVLQGRTSFIIAHRLSTVRKADLILVVEDGAIIEQGTHAELMAKGGRYRSLVDAAHD